MPTYELTLLLRTLPRPLLAGALNRTAGHIFQEGGIIRKINNLGHSPTPYKINCHGSIFKEANFFVVEFDFPTSSVSKLTKALTLDSDLIRVRLFEPVSPILPSNCTFEQENKPPPFRPEVQTMLKVAEMNKIRRERGKVKLNTGLDFDPFPS